MATTHNDSKILRVLMIGFSPVVLQGLQAILHKDEGIAVIEDAQDGTEALGCMQQAYGLGQPVDVVLTESRNNKMDGVRATQLIKDSFPEVAVLVLTENMNDAYVIDAIHAGAGGYIFLEDVAADELLQNIHRVVEGGTQMKAAVLHTAVDHLIQNGRQTLAERTTQAARLTEREVDVLRLMGNGDSNKLIAATLGITLDTTKKHVRSVIDKLEARSRTHASIIAAQAGIVGIPISSIHQDDRFEARSVA